MEESFKPIFVTGKTTRYQLVQNYYRAIWKGASQPLTASGGLFLLRF